MTDSPTRDPKSGKTGNKPLPNVAKEHRVLFLPTIRNLLPTIRNHQLSWLPLQITCIVLALVLSYCWFRPPDSLSDKIPSQSILPSLTFNKIHQIISATVTSELEKKINSEYISSITAQFHTALSMHNCKKALTILILGTSLEPLKHICKSIATELFAGYNITLFLTELEGNADPQLFKDTIVRKLETDEETCPLQVFLIEADELSDANRDLLEGAFDDTVPQITNNQNIVATRNGIFLLMTTIPLSVSKAIPEKQQGILRSTMSDKWTGRFYQRIRHIIIGK